MIYITLYQVSWSPVALVSISLLVLSLVFFCSNPGKKLISKMKRKKVVNSFPREEQDAKNREVIGEIIDGHHSKLSDEKRVDLKNKFKAWQKAQEKLFTEAADKLLRKRLQLINNDPYFYQKFKNIGSSHPPKEKEGKKLVLVAKDVFTEPFPSSHDMPVWAMRTQVADIFLLNGISVEESANYFQHEKEHLVNHKMQHGIILFDLYKYE